MIRLESGIYVKTKDVKAILVYWSYVSSKYTLHYELERDISIPDSAGRGEGCSTFNSHIEFASEEEADNYVTSLFENIKQVRTLELLKEGTT